LVEKKTIDVSLTWSQLCNDMLVSSANQNSKTSEQIKENFGDYVGDNFSHAKIDVAINSKISFCS